MEAEGLVAEAKPPPKPPSKTTAAAKKRKAASADAGRAGAGLLQLPKLPPVRTVPKGGAKRQRVDALPDLGGPGAGGPSGYMAPHMGHHSGAGGLGFPLDPLLSPSEMQLFNEVNALLSPTAQGGDWDMLAGLVGSARGGAALGSGSGGSSTMPLGDTPLSDMASVFSWFLNGTPTAAGAAAAAGGGPYEARVPTPRGAPAAIAGAAQEPPQPSAQSVAALIRALSPAVSPAATPRGAAGAGLMPAPGSRRAGGPSVATAAAAGSAAVAAGPSSGLTAEMGQRVLLQRLLHLRATGVGGGGSGAVPMTPFTAAMTEHVFSPLAGHGARRSPRLPAVKTGGAIATPMAAPPTVGAAASTPAFTPGELQLLLATLGGNNPFAPGIAHDKVAEAQASQEAAGEAAGALTTFANR
jgi:hypothetical protein